MGSRGDCFEKELIRRRTWPERRELIGEVFNYTPTASNG
jgi:hypothetical protein